MTKIELREDTRRSDPIRGRVARGGRAAAYKLNPGGFDVYVDGAHWGRITTEGKGSNGMLYHLQQIGGDGVGRAACREVPCMSRLTGNHPTRLVYYTAWSDKVYLRQLKSGESPASVGVRLNELVKRAIMEGALRDPAVIAVESKAAADKHRLSEAAALQEKNALWLKKAGDALGPYAHGMAAPVVADLKARIVDAMKWAQSQ